MSEKPKFMTHELIMAGEEYVSYSDYLLLQRERDEAREKIKRQAERIRELEGATNHAGGLPKYHGTDETDAMVERWQSAHIPAGFARRMEFERNEALRKAEERLTQLTAITNSEPRDYMALVTACRVHKDHIAQLAKERDEAWEDLEFRRGIYKVQEEYLEEAREKAERYRLEANALMLQRDEARQEIDRYREKNDLLPISWDV